VANARRLAGNDPHLAVLGWKPGYLDWPSDLDRKATMDAHERLLTALTKLETEEAG